MSVDPNIPAKYRARSLLRECRALVQRLFEATEALVSRRAGSEAFMQPQQIMTTLVERQEALREVIDELVEHQKMHKAIECFRTAVLREDAKIAKLSSLLRNAEGILQDAVDEATPRMNALDRANKHPVDVDEVISYGRKIGTSLAAPPGWDAMQPLGNHLLPAPPEEMMRSGRLGALELEEDPQEKHVEKEPATAQ